MASTDYYNDDGEILSSNDLESRGRGGGGSGESRFSSHFNSPSGTNQPWYSVIESSKAHNATKGLKFDQYQSYENVLTKLAQGDGTGLNLHCVDGHWAADMSGFGQGRGQGRILFDLYDGIIYIVEVFFKHYKK